jgi:hypothetical protein
MWSKDQPAQNGPRKAQPPRFGRLGSIYIDVSCVYMDWHALVGLNMVLNILPSLLGFVPARPAFTFHPFFFCIYTVSASNIETA